MCAVYSTIPFIHTFHARTHSRIHPSSIYKILKYIHSVLEYTSLSLPCILSSQLLPAHITKLTFFFFLFFDVLFDLLIHSLHKFPFPNILCIYIYTYFSLRFIYFHNFFFVVCFFLSFYFLSCLRSSFFAFLVSLELLYLYFCPFVFLLLSFSLSNSITRFFLCLLLSFSGFLQLRRLSCCRNTQTYARPVLSEPVKGDCRCFTVAEFPGTSFGGPCKEKMPGSQVDGVLMSLIELLTPSQPTPTNT
jgi:hypothetical protein